MVDGQPTSQIVIFYLSIQIPLVNSYHNSTKMAPMAVEIEAPSVSNSKVNGSSERVDSFDALSTNAQELTESMKRNGAIYIRNLVSKDDINSIVQEMRPHLDDDIPWEGVCFPPQTKRLCGVVAKSDTYRKKVVMNPLWLALSEETLSTTSSGWFGDIKAESVSRPILGGTVCFRVCPGAGAQGLHRDSMAHHLVNPRTTTEEYKLDREVSLSLFLAGTRTTKENGATRFCPGSHLEATEEPPSEDRAMYAEMEPGDALVMFSSVYHAGSANLSQNEERLVFATFMNRGTLRTVSSYPSLDP